MEARKGTYPYSVEDREENGEVCVVLENRQCIVGQSAYYRVVRIYSIES
jgi:hypothetical protein